VPGGRPAAGWSPGEILTDRHVLRLGTPPPAGTYRLLVGLYDGATGVRLADPVAVGPELAVSP
jgi:hypothetical protein